MWYSPLMKSAPFTRNPKPESRFTSVDAPATAAQIQAKFQNLGFDVTLQTSPAATYLIISDPDSGRKIKARLGPRSGRSGDDYVISQPSDLPKFYRYAQAYFHTNLKE
jgi:hypothetical protein